MALNSPGVEVTVIDESFYTPAAPGTVPLIVVATAENKTNAAGTGIAQGTLASNVSNAYRVTSQKELVDLFGVPFFEKTAASNTPIHGSERNEYGLLSAYSLLGVSNSVFVVRADVDLAQLDGTTTAPGAEPDDGQWWVDTDATAYGIQEWNGAPITSTGGQRFTNKVPLILTDDDNTRIEAEQITGHGRRPRGGVGQIGDYAIVFETTGTGTDFAAAKETARLYYKSAGNMQVGVSAGEWVLVGTSEWRASWPTVRGAEAIITTLTAGSIVINGSTINIVGTETLDDLVTLINSASIPGVSAKNISSTLALFSAGTESQAPSNAITIAGPEANLDELGFAAGTYFGVELAQQAHTSVPEWKSGDSQSRPTGSVWVKTTEPGSGARWRIREYNGDTSAFTEYAASLYPTTHSALFGLDRSGGGTNLPIDTLFVQTNSNEDTGYDSTPETVTFRIWRRSTTGATVITSEAIDDSSFPAGDHSFTIQESSAGSAALSASVDINFTALGEASDAFAVAQAINAVGLTNVVAAVTDANQLTITHSQGGDIRLTETSDDVLTIFTPYSLGTNTGTNNFYTLPAGAGDSSSISVYLASNWKPLATENFAASNQPPVNKPNDGQLWYYPEIDEADILLHNGTTWVGYRSSDGGLPDTDPAGPQVRATEPETQSDGTPLVDGDLWISTIDVENFPTIYRYNGALLEFQLVDKTDQVTEDGVLFADARWRDESLGGDSTGLGEADTIQDLLTSDFLDPDTPDPALYPKGMLLYNLRRSGGNVKRYAVDYIDRTTDNPRLPNDPATDGYSPDRWVTASSNNEDGSGAFLRQAQRSVVVQAIKSTLDTNQQVRDTERRNFNLIATPGYPEAMQNMVALNIDRGLTAFVVGDTPLRLPSDATSLTRWGTNELLVVDNNDDGIVTYDEYLGVFYPNGFTTDLGGANAVVPASHMMLRTIALSDNVAFPWFAPAGTRRGGITNATSVGFIDSDSGEFQTVALNEGQRDTLYDLKVNPITFFNGVGLVNYGQKTRARNASALDRINVARLVVFLRTQLDRLARPYVFEPNDKITRDEIKQAVESLLLELVGLRAIFDFAVVCDETNNTPARIDRNELYVDIAIEPVKAIEFIYIPLRVQNTGEI